MRLAVSQGLILAISAAFLGGCAEEVVAHLQLERDANHILVVLEQGGIDAKKMKDEESRDLRFNVHVPQEQAQQALSILEARDLPKTERQDTAAMFSEGGMIPTTQQERAKREVGIRGDIINSLRHVPRVVRVEAAVSIPESDPLRDINQEPPKPKASVIVVYRPDESNTPPLTPEDVQKFVQAALPEVRTSAVSVLLMPLTDDTGTTIPGQNGKTKGPIIDPTRGCVEKERVISIEVCKGNRQKVIKLVLIAVIVAGLLAGLAVIAVLRAMRYRKDLTRLTAQFQRHGK